MTATGYDECFRQHFAGLVALGLVATGDHDIARELAQETFVRLHRNWDSVSTYEHPAGWLRKVMSNLVIDYQRSRRAETRAVERLAGRTGSSTAGTSVVDGLSPSARWIDLIGPLPTRQRLIVTLYYGEDRSVAEIAGLLDVSPNTVKSALAKARTTLRALWEDDDA